LSSPKWLVKVLLSNFRESVYLPYSTCDFLSWNLKDLHGAVSSSFDLGVCHHRWDFKQFPLFVAWSLSNPLHLLRQVQISISPFSLLMVSLQRCRYK
jgi:hypothetical protein